VTGPDKPSTRAEPRPGELAITSKLEADCLVLSLRGELDLASSIGLERELDDADSAPGRVVIDLSGLVFMDSSGLRTLLHAQKQASSTGRQLLFRRGPYAVQRLLELTRTLDRFTFVD
jgi:anti-sigma B factor antagonist